MDAYNRKGEEAWDIVMGNMDKLSGRQRELAERYKAAGRDLVGNGTVKDYFMHEMGHHMQWEDFDGKTYNAVGEKMSQYSGKISGYATASKSEYFAESFAAYMKGERDILDPDYVAFLDKKLIAKDTGSGIMELSRKLTDPREGFKFISDETFNNLTIAVKKKGAVIVRGTKEAEEHLERQGAAASNIGDVLLFRKDVCISEVLEEIHHFEQNLSKMNNDKDETLRNILNEIDAKQYLLSVADKFKIPRNEIELTKRQLQSYQQQLEEYRKGVK